MIKIKLKGNQIMVHTRGRKTALVNESLNVVFALYQSLGEANGDAAALFLDNLPIIVEKCRETANGNKEDQHENDAL
jgi:hypothetical protein